VTSVGPESDQDRTLITPGAIRSFPLVRYLSETFFVDGGDARLADLDQACLAKCSHGSADYFSDGPNCRCEFCLVDGLGVVFAAFGQGKDVVGDARSERLEGHTSKFGQDGIDIAGQLLSCGPTDFGMRLEDLVEPTLGETQDRARGDGLKSNWVLPTRCAGDPNGTGSVEIAQRQMPAGSVLDECPKSSVGDDGEMRIVNELAGWQMKDPR
jgi:hypothetical protein